MKKIFNKDNLQKILFIGIVVLVFGVFMLSLTLGSDEKTENPNDKVETPDDSLTPTNPEDPSTPDSSEKEEEKFKTPCFETETYTIVRHFYELDDDEATQEMSLIQFGDKYFVSRGVSYTLDGETDFDVFAAMSGTVVSVNDSNVYGKTVVIDHGNGLQTEYIGLSETKVEKDNLVSQGDLIGVSGNTEYDVEAKNHVHFKVSLNGEYCNPLNVLGKTKGEVTSDLDK